MYSSLASLVAACNHALIDSHIFILWLGLQAARQQRFTRGVEKIITIRHVVYILDTSLITRFPPSCAPTQTTDPDRKED
jgi:hypothetical protein